MLRFLIATVLALTTTLANAQSVTEANQLKQEYRSVSLDQLIAGARKESDPRRYMIKPYGVRFEAILQQEPRPGKFTLVYDALKLWDITPLPDVSHAAYLRTPEGKIISVYVEDRVAARMLKELKAEQAANFFALHIYNYSKGPRLLLISFEATDQVSR